MILPPRASPKGPASGYPAEDVEDSPAVEAVDGASERPDGVSLDDPPTVEDDSIEPSKATGGMGRNRPRPRRVMVILPQVISVVAVAVPPELRDLRSVEGTAATAMTPRGLVLLEGGLLIVADAESTEELAPGQPVEVQLPRSDPDA